jgi:hypothetical protein
MNSDNNFNITIDTMLYKLIYTISFTLLIFSCKSTKSIKADNKQIESFHNKIQEIDIPYKEATNYFVKNTYKDGDLVQQKISSQSELDKILGLGMTMGENGEKSRIDFSKEYAIVVIGELTNKDNNINIISLKKRNEHIILTYKKSEGDTQTYYMRPVKVILIDNKFQGEVKCLQL